MGLSCDFIADQNGFDTEQLVEAAADLNGGFQIHACHLNIDHQMAAIRMIFADMNLTRGQATFGKGFQYSWQGAWIAFCGYGKTGNGL